MAKRDFDGMMAGMMPAAGVQQPMGGTFDPMMAAAMSRMQPGVAGDLGMSMPPAKAPRTVGLREGDWICPACGNHNFSDRMVCNMRKCGAARPGVAGTLTSIGGGNIPMNLQAATATQMTPMMQQAAQQMPIVTAQQMSMIQVATPRGAPKRGDDWICPACGNNNFADRLFCNMRKCGFARPDNVGGQADAGQLLGGAMGGAAGDVWGAGGVGGGRGMPSQPAMTMIGFPGGKGASMKGKPDDWICPACGNRNFSDRAFCNMRKCQTPRPLLDWSCGACGNMNSGESMTCSSCHAPRTDMPMQVFEELTSKGAGKGKGNGGAYVNWG